MVVGFERSLGGGVGFRAGGTPGHYVPSSASKVHRDHPHSERSIWWADCYGYDVRFTIMG